MKRIFMLAVVALFGVITAIDAQAQKPSKAVKKMAKVMVKEGWQAVGKPQPLEELLADYYYIVENSTADGLPIVVRSSANSLNMALRKAQNSAVTQQASMQGTMVSGIADISISNRQDSISTTETSVDATYRSSVEQTVSNLRCYMSVYRTLSDGTVEVQAFFLKN